MVLPFIGAGIATGIGTIAGLSLGPYIFNALTKPTSYHLLREEVDSDNKVAAPDAGLLVKTEYRDALPLLEPWVTDPDYERVSMINRLTATVWPAITRAILDAVLEGDMYNTIVYPQVKAQVFDKYPFIEDIFLGQHSLRHGKIDLASNPWLSGRDFGVGGVAPRLGGMRVVPTADDEVLLETCAIWGSKATFDVSAVLRFGRLRLVVPLRLANISFKADLRVVLRPLVEKFPCLGGVSVSLLRVPTVDFALELIKGVDVMALPLLPQIVHAALKVVLEPVTLPLLNKPLVPGLGLVLPNFAAFPIMAKYGLPDPPVGALKVTINRIEGMRGGSDLYCRAEVRRGRFKQTRTVEGERSPVFDEEFALIVDSFENDSLRIQVFNDDMGWNDTMLSELIVPFGEVVGTKLDPASGKEVTDFRVAEFVRDQGGRNMKMTLKKAVKKGGLKGSASKVSKSFASIKSFGAGNKAATAAAAAAATSPGGGAATSSPDHSPSAWSRLVSRVSRRSKKGGGEGQSPAASAAAAAAAAGLSDGEGAGTPPAAAGVGGGSSRLAGPGSATFGRATSMARSPSGAGPYEDTKDDIGTIFFKVEFVPFNKPEYDDVRREVEERSRTRNPYLSMFPPPPGRTLAMLEAGGGGANAKLQYGVLTVQLLRCVDLAPEGAKDMATYVSMKVTNDEKDEEQVSSTIQTETSPRWGDKFDFVLIPATSELHVRVFNRAGMLGNLVGSLFSKKKEDKDTLMGKLMIPVEDVARNGRIKETWSLQDAERGYIELNLTWQTCHLSQEQQRR